MSVNLKLYLIVSITRNFRLNILNIDFPTNPDVPYIWIIKSVI